MLAFSVRCSFELLIPLYISTYSPFLPNLCLLNNNHPRSSVFACSLNAMLDQRKINPSSSTRYSVPSWERKFVTAVGNMGWGRFLHAKKSLYLYTNILQWDDSVGAEAFRNAKSQFWAEVNNLRPHRNSAAAGPDACIDAIDWNKDTTDPELYKDWDRVSVEDEEDVDVIDTPPVSHISDLPIVASGWDDDEEPDMGDVPSCLKSLMKPIMAPSAYIDNEADPRNEGNANPADHGCRSYRRKCRSSYAHHNFRVNPLWVY